VVMVLLVGRPFGSVGSTFRRSLKASISLLYFLSNRKLWLKVSQNLGAGGEDKRTVFPSHDYLTMGLLKTEGKAATANL
jgi:hypothetical protein